LLKDQQGKLLVDVTIEFEDLFDKNFNWTIASVLQHAAEINTEKPRCIPASLTQEQ
jgi:hypothetical protein